MNPVEIYILLKRAGFMPDEATTMVAVAMAESSGRPTALNPDGEYSQGLFQINTDPRANPDLAYMDLYDPLQNAQAAKIVYDRQGLQAWTVTHQDKGLKYLSYVKVAMDAAAMVEGDGFNPMANWDGTPGYGGAPISAVGSGVPAGMNAQEFQNSIAVQRQANPEGIAGSATDVYMPGAEVLSTGFGSVLRYQVGDGVFIEFLVSDEAAARRSGYDLSAGETYYEPADALLVDYREAGDAMELAGLADQGYETMGEFFEDTIGQYFSMNDPARQDPEILYIIARVMANPDVNPDVITGWIQNTTYWNAQTDTAREWNGLSEAEQQARIEQQARLVVEDYWSATGVRLSITDSRIRGWAEEIASGQRTFASVYQSVRDIALQDPDSPLSRSIRQEEVAQRQYGVDIENQADTFRTDALNWGLQMSDTQLLDWADKMVNNVYSQADWDKFVRDQAEILYPWKGREVRTLDAALPWLDAVDRILETGPVDLTNSDVQAALQQGMPLFEFEQQLRKKPEWLETENANTELTNTAGRIGRAMGFI